MRKLIALGSSIVFCVALAACGGDDDDDAGTGGGGGGGGADFCQQARDFEDEFADAEPTDEEAMAALRDLADNAPDEISDDINGLLDLFDRIQAAGEDPEKLAELTEDAAGMEDSAQRVTDYFTNECGIDTESPTTE